MTPKKKAEQLVKDIQRIPDYCYLDEAKEIACILTDEIIEIANCIHGGMDNSASQYWTEIKKEIEKL